MVITGKTNLLKVIKHLNVDGVKWYYNSFVHCVYVCIYITVYTKAVGVGHWVHVHSPLFSLAVTMNKYGSRIVPGKKIFYLVAAR